MTSISAISAYSRASATTYVRPVHAPDKVHYHGGDDKKHAEKKAEKTDTSTHGPAVKVTLSPEAELLIKKQKNAAEKSEPDGKPLKAGETAPASKAA